MATEKHTLHHRNRNKAQYDLEVLQQKSPDLKAFLKLNTYGNLSVDFANPKAVKTLNKAILNHYYGISYWEFPDYNLCPPIPGRADYIHYMADLLQQSNFGISPNGQHIKCLDIGVGATCIYPIIAVVDYNWHCIGADVAPKSIAASNAIIASNTILKNNVICRLQSKPKHIFKGIIQPKERIDLTVCNPPFHSSKAEALKGTKRKIKNLTGKANNTPQLNFAGIHNELIYKGGELNFITTMILESKLFSKQCFWFSTLVSKQAHLRAIYKCLKQTEAFNVKTISMGTGNKITRIVAWTYLNTEEQEAWAKSRWGS
jgi:23S rRNA (adenine1618-N6)-methyltransferase